MIVKVRLFALTREIVGKAAFEQTLPQNATLHDFSELLFNTYPVMQNLGLKFAINMAYTSLDTVLHDGDEIACIPPVGGG